MNENPNQSSVFEDIVGTEPEIASRGARLGAAVIDIIIIYMAYCAFAFALGFAFRRSAFLSVQDSIKLVLLITLFIVLQVLYFGFLESTESQASIGKKILGIKVVTDSYERLSLKQSFGRSLAKLIPFAVFVILFGERNKGLHDNMCQTLVIKSK